MVWFALIHFGVVFRSEETIAKETIRRACQENQTITNQFTVQTKPFKARFGLITRDVRNLECIPGS